MNNGAFYPDVVAPYVREYWDIFHYGKLGNFFSGSNLQKNQILKILKISSTKLSPKKFPAFPAFAAFAAASILKI